MSYFKTILCQNLHDLLYFNSISLLSTPLTLVLSSSPSVSSKLSVACFHLLRFINGPIIWRFHLPTNLWIKDEIKTNSYPASFIWFRSFLQPSTTKSSLHIHLLFPFLSLPLSSSLSHSPFLSLVLSLSLTQSKRNSIKPTCVHLCPLNLGSARSTPCWPKCLLIIRL